MQRLVACIQSGYLPQLPRTAALREHVPIHIYLLQVYICTNSVASRFENPHISNQYSNIGLIFVSNNLKKICFGILTQLIY